MRTASFLVLLSLIGCDPAKNASPNTPAPPKPQAPPPEAPAKVEVTTVTKDPSAPPLAADEPDLSQESSCVTQRWTSIEPAWKRTEVAWDGVERTLRHEGQQWRFDPQGRVKDFGEGTPPLSYDAQGNVTQRGVDAPKTDATYRYRNTYDEQRRLKRVAASYQPAGDKPGAYKPYREYRYDEYGRITNMQVALSPGGPMIDITLGHDARNRLVRAEWSGGQGISQLDVFEWDEQGRLVAYERDGLVVSGGRARDGLVEWRQRYQYDDTGRLRRVEATDGPLPSKVQRDITLYSRACAAVGRMLPSFLFYPYVPLPEAATPKWGG
jgi:hypothetical protein